MAPTSLEGKLSSPMAHATPRAELQSRIAGPIAYPPTPFVGHTATAPAGRIDLAGFRRQIRFLVDHAVPVIVPCGGTGELFSLDQEEWRAVTEATVEEAGGSAMVMASVGGGVAQACRMAIAAAEIGCAAAQITMIDPMFGMIPAGAADYNRAVASSADIGFMLYRAKDVPLTIDAAVELAELDSVVALKEETGDIQWFRAFMAAQQGRLVGVCGGEGLFPYYAAEGAAAFATGIVSVAPQLSLDLAAAVTAGDAGRIREVQLALGAMRELRGKPGRLIPVIKEGLRLLGIIENSYCRPPLAPLSAAEQALVADSLRLMGVLA